MINFMALGRYALLACVSWRIDRQRLWAEICPHHTLNPARLENSAFEVLLAGPVVWRRNISQVQQQCANFVFEKAYSRRGLPGEMKHLTADGRHKYRSLICSKPLVLSDTISKHLRHSSARPKAKV